MILEILSLFLFSPVTALFRWSSKNIIDFLKTGSSCKTYFIAVEIYLSKASGFATVDLHPICSK
jgi:hypothetical protein